MRNLHYTVSELISKTRRVLEISFKDIWVDGEISNVHYHSSGHIYFTLKDGSSELRCAMFKSTNRVLRFQLEDGMRIMIYGSLSIFESRGQIQFIIEKLEVSGVGALYQAYETLKNKLESEGLFSIDDKKTIKSIPKMVGIITSNQGAALKDILNVLERRAPFLNIIVCPTRVQGDGAAEEISSAIIELSNNRNIDTIIIGRGGGSIEDLWAFNEEVLARTIYDCNIPIISAVGHETDFTIADFVSDMRAATPSVAAELVCLSKYEILQKMESSYNELITIVNGLINSKNFILKNISNQLSALQPLNKISANKKSLNHIYNTITKLIRYKLNNNNYDLDGYEKQLNNLGPKQVLDRGYSIATSKETNKIIRSAKSIMTGDLFSLQTREGILEAEKIS
ncbi:MAG: exodeoxyribonuclease VII large subunit [bacterium TMED217]|nr:MAG: exodeoxyribonuclease VII large subunit [bacterium TMED217]